MLFSARHCYNKRRVVRREEGRGWDERQDWIREYVTHVLTTAGHLTLLKG